MNDEDIKQIADTLAVLINGDPDDPDDYGMAGTLRGIENCLERIAASLESLAKSMR